MLSLSSKPLQDTYEVCFPQSSDSRMDLQITEVAGKHSRKTLLHMVDLLGKVSVVLRLNHPVPVSPSTSPPVRSRPRPRTGQATVPPDDAALSPPVQPRLQDNVVKIFKPSCWYTSGADTQTRNMNCTAWGLIHQVSCPGAANQATSF